MAKKISKSNKISKEIARVEDIIRINWKIPLSFLLGVVLTVLAFTVVGNINLTGNSTVPATLTDAHVNLIVITDNSCTMCDDVSSIPARVEQDFFNVTVSYVDINSAQGQALKNTLGLTGVPAVYFDSNVVNAGNYTMYLSNQWLAQVGSYYKLTPVEPNKYFSRTVSTKPTLDLFVMSHCPYGTAAETTMKNTLATISGFDFHVHFIGSVYTAEELNSQAIANPTAYGLTLKSDGKYYLSLHGSTEVDGDVAQLCAMKYHPDSWFNFTLAYNAANFNITSAVATMGYDASVMNNCVNSTEGWALFANDTKVASALSIGSSPTYLFDNTLTSQSYVGTYGPAATLCNLHPTLTGCSAVSSVQTASASGSC